MLGGNSFVSSLFCEYREKRNLKVSEPCYNDYINNSLNLQQKYAWIFVCGQYLFQEGFTVFWEQSSNKTMSFAEQTMSVDKYLSTFPCVMEVIEFNLAQKFCRSKYWFNTDLRATRDCGFQSHPRSNN